MGSDVVSSKQTTSVLRDLAIQSVDWRWKQISETSNGSAIHSSGDGSEASELPNDGGFSSSYSEGLSSIANGTVGGEQHGCKLTSVEGGSYCSHCIDQ